MSQDIVLIKTGQNGYAPKQVAENALTVGELIDMLQREDPDAKVVCGGYGMGAIWEPARGVEPYDPAEYGYEDEEA